MHHIEGETSRQIVRVANDPCLQLNLTNEKYVFIKPTGEEFDLNNDERN